LRDLAPNLGFIFAWRIFRSRLVVIIYAKSAALLHDLSDKTKGLVE